MKSDAVALLVAAGMAESCETCGYYLVGVTRFGDAVGVCRACNCAAATDDEYVFRFMRRAFPGEDPWQCHICNQCKAKNYVKKPE